MKALLVFLMGALGVSGAAFAQGGSTLSAECRPAFLACLQSGSLPNECLSVKASCDGSVKAAPPRSEIKTDITRLDKRGLSYVQMTIENTGGAVSFVDTLGTTVLCSDGSRQEAVFQFKRMLAPGETRTSSEQAVCISSQVAKIEDMLSAPAQTANASIVIECAPNSHDSFTVTKIGNRAVKFANAHGDSGTYNVTHKDGADLIEFVCAPFQIQKMSIIGTLKQQMRELFKSDSFEGVVPKATTIGVRN